ncbi:MAG TPA: fused MFS/spermidine synthase [Verrucomicrobiae bacterium]|nr:fused MFS/spermidine synthase [Verrucomicrobiae bacterium]
MPLRLSLPRIPRKLGSRGFVFLSGFSMMAVELLAGRVTAPFLGSSLYTWTGIIAAMLAGISLGAFVGGRLADRFGGARVRRICFILSGVGVMLAYFIAALIGPWLGLHLSVPVAMPMFALAVFFPPALFLAAIQPASIRADLVEADAAGHAVGSLNAWNAAGSLLGTYLTGFFFIGHVPTHTVWLAIAILLFGAGVFRFSR